MIYNNLYFLRRYAVITFLIILLLYIILFKIEYMPKYHVNAQIKDNRAYIYVPVDLINNIYNKKLSINDKDIKYQIINISDDLYNQKYVYKEIILELTIEDKYLIENNVLSLTFKLDKQKLITQLKKYIEKGIGL